MLRTKAMRASVLRSSKKRKAGDHNDANQLSFA